MIRKLTSDPIDYIDQQTLNRKFNKLDEKKLTTLSSILIINRSSRNCTIKLIWPVSLQLLMREKFDTHTILRRWGKIIFFSFLEVEACAILGNTLSVKPEGVNHEEFTLPWNGVYIVLVYSDSGPSPTRPRKKSCPALISLFEAEGLAAGRFWNRWLGRIRRGAKMSLLVS